MPAILYVFLSQGQRIIQRLGPAGNQIINRLVAFYVLYWYTDFRDRHFPYIPSEYTVMRMNIIKR